MILKLVRWLWLGVCLLLSWFLSRRMSVNNFIVANTAMVTGWSAYAWLAKRKLKWSLLSYILTPVLLWLAVWGLLVFLSRPERWAVVALALLLSWIWATTLNYNDHNDNWETFRGNLLSYVNSFIFFFAMSALFAAVTFFNLSFGWLFWPVLLLALVLHWQIMAASHLAFGAVWLHSLLSALLLVEFFGALLMLPTSFLVNGLVMTVVFYVVSGVSRCDLTSVLSRSLVSRYLLWGGFIIFVILITARWQ